MMNINFHHEIYHDPEPEDAGTITVTAIFGESDNLQFMATSPAEEFIDDENDECPCKENLNYFLMEAGINDDVIFDAMIKLVDYVDEITCSTSNEYSPECALEVWLDLGSDDLDDDDEDTQIEEAVQVSFDQTNNIQFRPANKLVVKSLSRRIYKKIIMKMKKKEKKIISSSGDEQCTICLEEFNNGGRLVTLPCGHEFDDECVVKWFETSHVCPLCRFELPCEDQ